MPWTKILHELLMFLNLFLGFFDVARGCDVQMMSCLQVAISCLSMEDISQYKPILFDLLMESD